MVQIVSTVEFAGLIGFQPLIVLEMFDKEHVSLGVGSLFLDLDIQVKFAFNLYSFMVSQ